MRSDTILVPELLAPAGNFEKLRSAFNFGADAVYLAGQRFGMRAAADNFSNNELKDAIDYAHRIHKKIYVTLNVMPREEEFYELEKYLEILSEISPDGVIVADLGVFRLCRKLIPSIPIHISTQAAVVNSHSCNAWYEMGAKRIVLARELSLSDIEKIRKNIPSDLELECFVHGSMCVSFSGRCMLSEYYTGRDANRGECTQPCRWIYRFHEEKRPEDVLTAQIYPEGTYIFGSKDLCMIDHVQELAKVGINSLKIEGRMKSSYYTALVSNAYRIALDEINQPQNTPSYELMKELQSVSHREFCTGYYFDPTMSAANLASTNGYIGEQAFLCSVEKVLGDGRYLCKQKNKFYKTDNCEFVTPGKLGKPIEILSMTDEDNNNIESCPHPQMLFHITTNETLKVGDLIRKSFV